MKNELGIEKCCKNCCWNRCSCNGSNRDRCISNNYKVFCPSPLAYDRRIRELQQVMREEADAIDLGVLALKKHYEEQIQRLKEQQFTKKEAEKIETFLTHGYQMMINENKKIFSKLGKMKANFENG